MKKSITILLFAAALFSACEKEGEKVSEKDYRDKWVGEYTCKKEMQIWQYCQVFNGDTLVGMQQQFISCTADGTMKVERCENRKLRFISDMISNEDYDTTGYNPNNKNSGWGWNIQHFKDTITLEVDDSGILINLEQQSHSSSDIGHCYSNNIEFKKVTGGNGGGAYFVYKCTR